MKAMIEHLASNLANRYPSEYAEEKAAWIEDLTEEAKEILDINPKIQIEKLEQMLTDWACEFLFG